VNALSQPFRFIHTAEGRTRNAGTRDLEDDAIPIRHVSADARLGDNRGSTVGEVSPEHADRSGSPSSACHQSSPHGHRHKRPDRSPPWCLVSQITSPGVRCPRSLGSGAETVTGSDVGTLWMPVEPDFARISRLTPTLTIGQGPVRSW